MAPHFNTTNLARYAIRNIQGIKKELIIAFSLYVISALLLFAMNVALAKRVDVSVYGQFSYAISIVSILAMVTSFGLPNATIKFLSLYISKKQYLNVKGLILFSIIAIIIISAIAAIIIFFISTTALNHHEMADAIKLIPILLPFAALGLWRSKASRGLQRLVDSLTPEGIIRPALIITLLYISYIANIDISMPILNLILTFSYASSLIYGFFLLYKSIPLTKEYTLKKNFAYEEVKKWAKCVGIMFSIDIFQEILIRCDVLIAGMTISSTQVGLYAACSRIAFLNLFFLKIVDIVFAPKMAVRIANEDKLGCWNLLKSSSVVSTLGSIPLYLMTMIFPEKLLMIFGGNYTQGTIILQILATGQFINAMTGSAGYSLLMSGNESYFSKICIIYSFFSILICFISAKTHGTTGLAIAFSTSICIYNLTLFISARSFLTKQIDKRS